MDAETKQTLDTILLALAEIREQLTVGTAGTFASLTKSAIDDLKMRVDDIERRLS
jgi:hypothetical protein